MTQREKRSVLEFDDAQTGEDTVLGCLTYQSRATTKPSRDDLAALMARARSRNRDAGVTGMLLYERGRYLQTLEGPPDGLEKIWSSVRNDSRHTDIEVLTQHFVPARLFSEWDMLLYGRSPNEEPTLLSRMSGGDTLARHVGVLAEHALNADETATNELIAARIDEGWTSDDLTAKLIEPAARAMGDAWMADECSEFDLTLGIGMLQIACHAVRHTPDPEAIRTRRYTIVVAAVPGERHRLGQSLLADQLSDQGWSVDRIEPHDNAELVYRLAQTQPDALDLSLSDALPRSGALAELRKTISKSRIAVSTQPVVVSVGGRLFAEAMATAEHVGADHARRSVAAAAISLSELVRLRRM